MKRLLVIQHIEREGPGLFLNIAAERGIEVKIFRPDLNGFLPNPRQGDLLLILGGANGNK